MKQTIAVFGDSFAIDKPGSWVNTLSSRYDTQVFSQPGCSEYKIHQQILNNSTVAEVVIVSHTSWSRIPVERHPVHTSGFHEHCDLLYADCEANGITSATEFFQNHFWEQFWLDTYKLYRQQITDRLIGRNVIHLDFFKHGLASELCHIDFSDLPDLFPGDVCHMNQQGNDVVATKLEEYLNA